MPNIIDQILDSSKQDVTEVRRAMRKCIDLVQLWPRGAKGQEILLTIALHPASDSEILDLIYCAAVRLGGANKEDTIKALVLRPEFSQKHLQHAILVASGIPVDRTEFLAYIGEKSSWYAAVQKMEEQMPIDEYLTASPETYLANGHVPTEVLQFFIQRDPSPVATAKDRRNMELMRQFALKNPRTPIETVVSAWDEVSVSTLLDHPDITTEHVAQIVNTKGYRKDIDKLLRHPKLDRGTYEIVVNQLHPQNRLGNIISLLGCRYTDDFMREKLLTDAIKQRVKRVSRNGDDEKTLDRERDFIIARVATSTAEELHEIVENGSLNHAIDTLENENLSADSIQLLYSRLMKREKGNTSEVMSLVNEVFFLAHIVDHQNVPAEIIADIVKMDNKESRYAIRSNLPDISISAKTVLQMFASPSFSVDADLILSADCPKTMLPLLKAHLRGEERADRSAWLAIEIRESFNV